MTTTNRFILLGIVAILPALAGDTACIQDPTVSSLGDDGSSGTLRATIEKACAGSQITIGANGTISLRDSIDISKDLTIQGGSSTTTIAGRSRNRLFIVESGAHLSLSNLVISDGSGKARPKTKSGNGEPGAGGAIFVDTGAGLALQSVHFLNNGAHGTKAPGMGGAVFLNSAAGLRIGEDVAFLNNAATDDMEASGFGGALYLASGAVAQYEATPVLGSNSAGDAASSDVFAGGDYRRVGVASKLNLEQQAISAALNSPFPPLQVDVQDGSGNPLVMVPVTFTAPDSGPGGTFDNGNSSMTTYTDASGRATAVFTANSNAGAFTLRVSSRNISSNLFLENSVVPSPIIGPETLSVLPSSLNFGMVPVGYASIKEEVNVDGGFVKLQPWPIVITAITISGPNASNFHFTSCALNVEIEGCTILVTFVPSAAGERSATLRIAHGTTIKTVALSGFGGSGPFGLSPTSLNFGVRTLNTTGASQTVTLQVPTTTTLTGSSFTVSLTGTNPSDFSFSKSCSIQMTSTCAITVSFIPRATGVRSAILDVKEGTTTKTVSLTGTGQ